MRTHSTVINHRLGGPIHRQLANRPRTPLHVYFQAEDGIRCLVRSRGLGDVYKRQAEQKVIYLRTETSLARAKEFWCGLDENLDIMPDACLLYTSDAADERSSVDLGGRRII